jgi:hypothetical protein
MPAAVPGTASGPAAQLAAVRSGAAQMRGVNLGSWLVLEKWMSPKPWDGIDGEPWGERQLMLAAQQQGKTAQVSTGNLTLSIPYTPLLILRV